MNIDLRIDAKYLRVCLRLSCILQIFFRPLYAERMRNFAFAIAASLFSLETVAQVGSPAAASGVPPLAANDDAATPAPNSSVPAIALSGAGDAVPTMPPGPLTFQTALSLAEAQSLDAKRAALAVELASLDRALVDYDDDARVNLFGTLSARYGEPNSGGTSGPTGSTTKAVVNDASVLALARSKRALTKNQAYGTQLSKTFLDFGRHDAKVKQAEAVKTLREMQVGEVSEALRYKVARVYAALIGFERLATLAADQVRIAGDKLDEQRRNYKKGLRPESDVVTAEVESGRAALGFDRANADVRAARLALGQMLGASVDLDHLQLTPGAYKLRAPAALTAIVLSWQGQQKSAAMARREKEWEALRADESAIDAAKRPTISGALTVQEGAALENEPEFKPVVTGSVGVSWDLPWNGQSRDEMRRIAVRRQDIDVQAQVEARDRTDRDAAAREVLAAGARQWEALTRQLALVDRQHGFVRQRYESGQISALELGQSEADLLASRTELAKLANTLLSATLDVAEAHAVADLGALFN